MIESDKRHTILMVDDDAEDCQLVRNALSETGQAHELHLSATGKNCSTTYVTVASTRTGSASA